MKKLKGRGSDVQLVIIDNVTHYEVNGFSTALREAIPWISKAWQ